MTAIAVAVHDVEPATFSRCALIRDWLSDQGITRATLLVVPAPHLHPIGAARGEMLAWLVVRRGRRRDRPARAARRARAHERHL